MALRESVGPLCDGGNIAIAPVLLVAAQLASESDGFEVRSWRVCLKFKLVPRFASIYKVLTKSCPNVATEDSRSSQYAPAFFLIGRCPRFRL